MYTATYTVLQLRCAISFTWSRQPQAAPVFTQHLNLMKLSYNLQLILSTCHNVGSGIYVVASLCVYGSQEGQFST